MWHPSLSRQHAGQLTRPKLYKNMSEILNSGLVKVKLILTKYIHPPATNWSAMNSRAVIGSRFPEDGDDYILTVNVPRYQSVMAKFSDFSRAGWISIRMQPSDDDCHSPQKGALQSTTLHRSKDQGKRPCESASDTARCQSWRRAPDRLVPLLDTITPLMCGHLKSCVYFSNSRALENAVRSTVHRSRLSMWWRPAAGSALRLDLISFHLSSPLLSSPLLFSPLLSSSLPDSLHNLESLIHIPM